MFVKSEGLRIAVFEEGRSDGPTVLLVSGHPDSHTVWDPVVARLQDRFRFVRYDPRGVGDSSVPSGTAAYRIARLADDFAAVLAAVSVDSDVHVVAHGWGSSAVWEHLTGPRGGASVASFTSVAGPDLAHLRRYLADSLRQPHRPRRFLRGAAQLLARELNDPKLHDYTNIIIDEADRLRHLVDPMLGPHRAPEKQKTNIHEVLERVRQLVEAESDGSIRIIRDYDPSIPDILGDREQLIQAFLNVIRNAQQALRQDSPSDSDPTIVLRTRTLRQLTIGTHRHRLVCSVDIVDNGPGIPADLRASIFLPMVSGRAEGTGLGLSIAQSILNQHNGLIECRSEPGNTVFSLHIPLEHAS